MIKKESTHTITGSKEVEKVVVVITRNPENVQSGDIRGCCPSGFPFGDFN
jgi:hypothetical protein